MTRPTALALALCAAVAPLAAQETATEPLSIEWIYSDAARDLTATPEFQWLDDGSALLLDPRVPDADRTIERLDPATMVRLPAVDAGASLDSLKKLRNDAPDALSWPAALDGARAVYDFDGDLYVLEFATSTFRRLTETPEEEKAAQLSPDGSLVSFVRANDLYVYDLDDDDERRLTTDGGEALLNGTLSWVYWEEVFGRRDIGYWWADDSESIAYLQTDESEVAVSHFVDFAPSVPRVLTQRYPKAGTANPEVRVGVVGVEGAGTTWVDIDPESYEYIARVKWLPGGDRLSVQTMNRAQDRLRLLVADRATGAARLVLEETDPAWVNIHDDLEFLGDGDRFLWASERDGFAHLYLYDLDGHLIRRLTEGPWSIRSTGGGPFWLRRAIAAVDEEAGLVYFTALEESSIEGHLYRVGLDGEGFERITEEPGTHGVTFSADARYYFDLSSDLHTPPALRLHEADGTLVATLAEPRTDLVADLDLQFPELLTIPAADGFPMPAELLKPRDFDPSKQYPLILYVYGGPSAPTVADTWRSSILFDNVLAEHGYLVALVDNRVSTAISHELESLVLRKMSGEVERSDVLDAVAWLKDQPYVDPDRVGVWGWSGGGSFTLNLMTHSDAFKAGIAVAAVTDWRYYDTKWAEFAMKAPDDNPEGYDATSFVQSAGDLHGRLLLVHGTHDDNVHPQNAWAFVDALIEHNVPFELMIYPMRKHGITDRPARIHLYSTMLDFWERNL